jgi:hypothetical protein
LKDLLEIKDVKGVASIVSSSAKILHGRDNMGDFVNRIYGFFAEAKFNRTLQDKGYELEQIGCIHVKDKPYLFNHDGSDPFIGIDLKDPKSAFPELIQRGLIQEPNKGNGRLVRILNKENSSQVIYYDRETGELIFNKTKKTNTDQTITIIQPNKQFSNFELDLIAKDPNGRTCYFEHKINLSTFLKKNTEKDLKGKQNQLENLISVSQAHNVQAVVMMDLSEITNERGEIDLNNELFIKTKTFLSETQERKNIISKLKILDSEANDVSSLFLMPA